MRAVKSYLKQSAGASWEVKTRIGGAERPSETLKEIDTRQKSGRGMFASVTAAVRSAAQRKGCTPTTSSGGRIILSCGMSFLTASRFATPAMSARMGAGSSFAGDNRPKAHERTAPHVAGDDIV